MIRIAWLGIVLVLAATTVRAQADKPAKNSGESPAGKAPQEDKDAKRAKAELQARYDAIVRAFILYDIGELRGVEGQQARAAFDAMKDPAAIPSLVKGLNAAATMRNSCPVMVINSKLQSLLASSGDAAMARHVRDNLAVSHPNMPYGTYLDSMRLFANNLLNNRPPNGLPTQAERPATEIRVRVSSPNQLRRDLLPIEEWKFEDIVTALTEEKGVTLLKILEYVRDQKGAEYTKVMVDAIDVVPEDTKPTVRGMLAQRLVRMTDDTLRTQLKDKNPELRSAAARAIGYKGSLLLAELIVALRDSNDLVGESAHGSLVKLTGEDFGPKDLAKYTERYIAAGRWEKWLTSREAKP